MRGAQITSLRWVGSSTVRLVEGKSHHVTERKLGRRQVVEMCLVLGGFALAGPIASALAQPSLRRTPEQILGPFYPVAKPLDQDKDLTIVQGKSGRAPGTDHPPHGPGPGPRGQSSHGGSREIWQANMHGRYTHPSDSNPAPLDPNFDGFAVQTTDAAGRYRFKSIKPGAYPTEVEGGRDRRTFTSTSVAAQKGWSHRCISRASS